MAVYHVLKDGSKTETIEGHIVKVSDAKRLYKYINEFVKNERIPNKKAV